MNPYPLTENLTNEALLKLADEKIAMIDKQLLISNQ